MIRNNVTHSPNVEDSSAETEISAEWHACLLSNINIRLTFGRIRIASWLFILRTKPGHFTFALVIRRRKKYIYISSYVAVDHLFKMSHLFPLSVKAYSFGYSIRLKEPWQDVPVPLIVPFVQTAIRKFTEATFRVGCPAGSFYTNEAVHRWDVEGPRGCCRPQVPLLRKYWWTSRETA